VLDKLMDRECTIPIIEGGHDHLWAREAIKLASYASLEGPWRFARIRISLEESYVPLLEMATVHILTGIVIPEATSRRVVARIITPLPNHSGSRAVFNSSPNDCRALNANSGVIGLEEEIEISSVCVVSISVRVPPDWAYSLGMRVRS
jgi:hypothetical protein